MAVLASSVNYNELGNYPGIKPMMTEEELQGLCAEWQRILGLADWKVKAQFVRSYHFGNTTQSGHATIRPAFRHAVLDILDPLDMQPDTIFPDEPERVLLHELLHIHFVMFDSEPGTTAATLLEQAINALADGLMTLARTARG